MRTALLFMGVLLFVSCADVLFLITPEFALVFPDDHYLESLSDKIRVRTLEVDMSEERMNLRHMLYLSFFPRVVTLQTLEPLLDSYFDFFQPNYPPDIYWMQFSPATIVSSGKVLKFSRIEAIEKAARALAEQGEASSQEALLFWRDDLFTTEEKEAFYRGYQSVTSLQSLREFIYVNSPTFSSDIIKDINSVGETSAWAFFLGEGLIHLKGRVPSGWVVVESFLPEFGKLFDVDAVVTFDFRDVIDLVVKREKMISEGYVSARFIRY